MEKVDEEDAAIDDEFVVNAAGETSDDDTIREMQADIVEWKSGSFSIRKRPFSTS